MSEYINREALLRKIRWAETVEEAFVSIRRMPAADVVKVRYGKWILNKEKHTWECSECHYQTDSIFDESKSNYCKNCGCEMVGE